MNTGQNQNRRGFILLPLLLILALIALFAYLLNHTGGLESRVARSRSEAIAARYVAEAGMNHAKWFLSNDCTFRAPLANIPFGTDHSYGVLLTDNTDGTIHLTATGLLHGQNPDSSTHITEIMVDDYRCVQLVPQAIYWSDWGDTVIRRVELDGSGTTELLTAENGLLLPKPLAIDQQQRTMYWGDGNLIFRAEVDGSYMEQVIDCLTCLVAGIDIDPAHGLFYYTDQVNNRVSRAALNGTADTTLINTGLSKPSAIRVDRQHGLIFFADEGNAAIKRAQLDGTSVTTVATGLTASALALDTATSKIYFFDRTSNCIQRLNYNGGALTLIAALGGGTNIDGLDLELHSGLLYWARQNSKTLQRANLDGTNITDIVVSGAGSAPWDLRLGPAQPIILPRSKGPYWTEDQGNKKKVVRRAELDGSNQQTLVSAQKQATHIKYDSLTEQLFWAGDKAIMRSTLRGAKLSVVLNCNLGGCGDVFGLALDPANQQIYFVDHGGKAIRRVNYDGTTVTTLVSGLSKPLDIDLDLAVGKMYWVDEGTKSLSRANLDGSSQETVLTNSLGHPVRQAYAIAMDGPHALLYWFDNQTQTIYRSTPTGAAITPLIDSTQVTEAQALALDLDGGKLYWADKGAKQIRRANLDGSAPETAVDLTVGSNKPPMGIVIVPAFL